MTLADSDLRVPPHDIAAERAVLGAMMLTPHRISDISGWLQEGDFYTRDHRMLYRAVLALADRKVQCDAVTVTDWFETNGLLDNLPDRGYIIELSNETYSSANLVPYAEIVLERSRLRSVIDIASRAVEAAWAGAANARDIVATTTHELGTMRLDDAQQGLMPAKPILQKLFQQRMERLQAGKGSGLLGLPTPWKDLNKVLRGLRDGNVYIVAGRPNMGKSIWGVQLAAFTAARGDNTALFSVEMTPEECMARAVACVGEIAYEWVEDPFADVDKDMAELYESRQTAAYASLLESKLQIDATPSLTVGQWVARARRAHRREPVRLIVLDHMHDMGIDHDKARFEYGRIAQAGKMLAKEFSCPVVILGQLNRANTKREDKRPGMADLRESGEIEQKADVIILLHREDYYDKESSLAGSVEAIIAKGRNIRSGQTVFLENRFGEMRMDDWVGAPPIDDKPQRGAGRRGKGGLR